MFILAVKKTADYFPRYTQKYSDMDMPYGYQARQVTPTTECGG